MKTALSTLPVLVFWLATPASAGSGYWHAPGFYRNLECTWRSERPGFVASTDSSKALIALPCDAQAYSAVHHQFHLLDQKSLAGYNRGLIPSSYPVRPAAAAAVIRDLGP